MLHYKTYKNSDSHEWVVFVHGIGGSSSIWFKQMKDFRQHFNILFVDLRGHGKSKGNLKDIQEYTFEKVSFEIIDVLDHLGIKSAHFVGISLGSIIINMLSMLVPERFKSAILGGAITRFNTKSRILISLGDMVKSFMPYMWLYGFFAWILMPKKAHSQSRMLFVQEAKKLGGKEFLKWFKLSKEVEPVFQQLRKSENKVPKLYVMGDQDHMFLPFVYEDTHRDSLASVAIIPECGHVCNIDKPDKFNEIVISFINELIQEKKSITL